MNENVSISIGICFETNKNKQGETYSDNIMSEKKNVINFEKYID